MDQMPFGWRDIFRSGPTARVLSFLMVEGALVGWRKHFARGSGVCGGVVGGGSGLWEPYGGSGIWEPLWRRGYVGGWFELLVLVACGCSCENSNVLVVAFSKRQLQEGLKGLSGLWQMQHCRQVF
mmetsp:Transcript_43284/g.50695  ORF Transcript_43284/g.50695 Transcript_43284/m.50695 type:complete len:125 (+) Transcript_43284:71-445(+)